MKDPAILFYKSDWLVATKTMRADEKGWYLNLILFQFEMGDLPDEIEELANLCDVRISEFERFKQAWKQVLKQKFKQNENGRLYNEKAMQILRNREQFIEKRSSSGKIGYVVKFMKSEMSELKATNEEIEYIKETFDFENTDIKDKQVLKQVLKQSLKLYRNGIKNRIKNKDVVKEGGMGGEKTISQKPVKKTPDLPDEIIMLFQTAYQQIRGDPYVITNREKERGAAGKLLRLFKQRNPGLDTEATKLSLFDFFKRVCDIDDKWLYTNMSLTMLFSKINEILTILKNGKSKKPDLSKGESTISDAFKRSLVERMLASEYSPPVPGG